MNTVNEVRKGIAQLMPVVDNYLAHTQKTGAATLAARSGQGIKNWFDAATGQNPTLASMSSTYPLAIRSLQAVVAGQGSGFRLNQSEINMIQQRWPKFTGPNADTAEMAKAKLQWELWFLQNKENSYFKPDWRITAEPSAPGLPKTGVDPNGSNNATQAAPRRRVFDATGKEVTGG
jgi:hypothetical protein